MNLNHLSDQELLSNTQAAVGRERAATTEVLYHLLEVEIRMLDAQMGLTCFCSSIGEDQGGFGVTIRTTIPAYG